MDPQPDPLAEAPEAQGSRISASGSHEVGGWVTAAPPSAMDVVQHVVAFPRLIWRHWDLVITSVQRELQARFTGTLLGWAWPLVHPLFMFAVYYFIFTRLLAVKFGELPPELKSAMGVYMFTGIIPWSAFGESLGRGCNVIVENGNLIKKLAFPTEVLPLNIVLVNLVTMMFALVIFIVGTFTPVWIQPDWPMLLWIPLLILLQGVFTYGVTLFLATLQVFLRDTAQFTSILVTVWMFVTPLFWAPELIQDFDFSKDTLAINPMYHIIYAWRLVLMNGEPAQVLNPEGASQLALVAESAGVFALWALGAFLVGYTFFILSRRHFADEV